VKRSVQLSQRNPNKKKLGAARYKNYEPMCLKKKKHKKNRFISEPVLPCGERGSRTLL